MDQTPVTTNFTTLEAKIVGTCGNVCFASPDRNCSSIPGGVGEGENEAYVRVGGCQPRPQGLLAFQYGGGRREDPGTQRTKTIADWCIL